MDKLKKLLEHQSILWVLIAGIALCIFGVYLLMDINEQEALGSPVRMKEIFQLIYEFGGKYTVLAIFEAVGLISIISAIQQLRGKL